MLDILFSSDNILIQITMLFFILATAVLGLWLFFSVLGIMGG